MTVSRLDQLYRRLLLTKFFTRGWGKPDNLKRLFAFRKILSNRDTCQHLVAADYPINIDKEYKDGDCVIIEGHFTSPFIQHLPGIMPKEVETASFQMILPHQWRHSTLKPVCIHLAGTGDHYFWRRRILMARPLLKEAGIASIILENPYYGARKPKQQLRSSLHNVSDLFVMGGALVLESLALLHWCERNGWGPLGLSGVSMGGHMASGAATMWPKPISLVPILSWTTASIIFTQMASLAATNWIKPITLVPCLSWSTASCVFTQGVMSGAIPWKTLQEQFFENSVYQDEIRKLIISPEDKRKAYAMGQQFVKDYSHNIRQVETIHEQLKDHQPIPPSGKTGPVSAQPPDCFPQGYALNHPSTLNHPSLLNHGSTLNHPTSLVDPIVNSGKVTTPSNPGSKSSLTSDGQTDIDLKLLTCEEYISRVDNQSTFKNEEPGSRILSSSKEPMESPLSSVLSSNSTPVLGTFIPASPSVSLHHQHSSLSSTTSLQPQVVLSMDPSTSVTDKRSKQFGTSTKGLNTSSGRSSQSQAQSSIHPVAGSNSLTLKDAFSKSRLLIPNLSSSSLVGSEEHLKDLQQEALDFMRGVMDECTHLGNFSVPVDPQLVIIVSAKQDAYVPKEGVIGLDQLWPGCEVRYLDQGHVGAVLFNQSAFRKAIVDSFDRQIKKYYQNPGSPHMEHTAQSAS